jgi:hypothetical protein
MLLPYDFSGFKTNHYHTISFFQVQEKSAMQSIAVGLVCLVISSFSSNKEKAEEINNVFLILTRQTGYEIDLIDNFAEAGPVRNFDRQFRDFSVAC